MDNDLMARRLRPPSEPPRPQNGHSQQPTDTPSWTTESSATESSATEIPWDRPADEPWPPATEEATDDSWFTSSNDSEPLELSAATWPPAAPPQTESDDSVAVPLDADAEAAAVAEPVAQDETAQADAETEAAAVAEPVAQDETAEEPQPEAEAEPDAEAAAVAEPVAQDETAEEPQPEAEAEPETEAAAVAEPVAQDETAQEPQPEAEAEPETEAAEAEPMADAETAGADEDESSAESESESANDSWPETELTSWDTSESPMWGSPTPWDPQPSEESVEAATAVADPAVADETDISVPGRPAWDAPSAEWDEDGAMDDRPLDMFGEYQDDDMVPVVSERVAAAQAAASEPESEPGTEEEPRAQTVSDPTADLWAAAESDPAPWAGTAMVEIDPDAVAPWETESEAEPTPQDPYDADAPVLEDVEPMSAPTWNDWSPTGLTPVAPLAVGGRLLRPTPPDDLFVQSGREWNDTFAEPFTTAAASPTEANDEPGMAAEQEIAVDAPQSGTVPSQPVPATSLVITTGPGGEQQLVLRIELAIVDPTSRLRPADEARRVGPWSDDEPLTPRHPEFEPRTHFSSSSENDDEPATEKPYDPWALAPMAEQNPTASWVLDAPTHDPLSNLPAATFAPAAPLQAISLPAGDRFVPEVAPKPAKDQPSAPADGAPATPVAAPATRSAANGNQSDLWFLASEPTVESTNSAEVAASTQSSSMLTIAVTIAAAVVVIFLVLAFLALMTSALH